MTTDGCAGTDVRADQFTNTVIAEAGPLSDGLGARLVFDEAKSELETRAIATVTIISDTHDNPRCIQYEWYLHSKYPKTQAAFQGALGHHFSSNNGGMHERAN